MAAYVIGDVEVKDPEGYKQYTSKVLATIERHGGRFLVRGGPHHSLEGKWQPHRVVVIEFPNMAALEAWYRSSDYGPLVKIRQRFSEGSLVAVEGVS
jgi:uncharacterized protein (DUF1330 family)